jgi:hypothetical protein
LPAECNSVDATFQLILLWQKRLQLGGIHSGYPNKHLLEVISLRGPPSKI